MNVLITIGIISIIGLAAYAIAKHGPEIVRNIESFVIWHTR